MYDHAGISFALLTIFRVSTRLHGNETGSKKGAPGLGDGMIHSFQANGLSPKDATADALTTLFAGEVTVAAAVSGIMLLLSSNPRILQKLQKEIDDFEQQQSSIEQGSAKHAPNADLLTLPYLQAVIREGLRYYPPTVDPLPRVAPPEGDVLECHGRRLIIPGGTKVVTSIWTILRREDVFGSDADTFRPERWIDKDEAQLARMRKVGDLIFGFGRMQCLGISIARIMINKAVFEVRRPSIYSCTFDRLC